MQAAEQTDRGRGGSPAAGQGRHIVRLAESGFVVVDTATAATTADLLVISGCPGQIVPAPPDTPGTFRGIYYFSRHRAEQRAAALNANGVSA
jgi:hypothetical protein